MIIIYSFSDDLKSGKQIAMRNYHIENMGKVSLRIWSYRLMLIIFHMGWRTLQVRFVGLERSRRSKQQLPPFSFQHFFGYFHFRHIRIKYILILDQPKISRNGGKKRIHQISTHSHTQHILCAALSITLTPLSFEHSIDVDDNIFIWCF